MLFRSAFSKQGIIKAGYCLYCSFALRKSLERDSGLQRSKVGPGAPVAELEIPSAAL